MWKWEEPSGCFLFGILKEDDILKHKDTSVTEQLEV